MRMPLAFALLPMLLLGTGRAADVDAPTILSKLHHVHPRLLMTTGTVAQIKGDLPNDPWLKSRYEMQKKTADRTLKQAPSRYVIPDGLRLLATSRRVLERVSNLAIVYRLTGDKRYLDRCWAELDAAAHFKDWNPRHFLDTAEMTAAFAIGYDWLYHDWTSAQRGELRKAIISHGLEAGLNVYRNRPKWWPSYDHNWNVVCNGGLAMGALAIADEEPGIAGDVLARGIKSVPKCLTRFAPDGGWVEGPGYWGYTTLYESMYLGSLETACGTDFGLASFPGMDKGGWFPAYLNGPSGGAFNFADAHEGRSPTAGPQLLWMARRFHEPRYAQYQIEKKGGPLTALELIWGPGIERKPWDTIDTDRYFRGVEAATMRDRWNDPNAWFVGFKAGSNAVNHAHLDIGSFILESSGVRWIVDLGPDDYNLPAYFGNKRWTYYRLRAEGHNTLVLDPSQGPDQDPKGRGKITHFVSTPEGVSLTADLTGAYPAAERATRSLSFVRGKSLTVSDNVELKKAGEICWFVQTRANAATSDGGRTIALSENGKIMKLSLLKPAGAHFETGPAAPLPTSPHPPKQAANTGVTRIAVYLRGVKAGTIEVRFHQD